jgi:anaerobic magnesium-protoporphyrin IX monomethyl ester cyclase
MKNHVLMVYPKQGFSGVFVQHAPISLLYASAGLVQQGTPVSVLDNRLFPNDWREELKKQVTSDTAVVGLSVMSGRPIENAIEVSRLVKQINPEIKVVWGGPHATFNPESIFDEDSVDFAVSGYASKTFAHLVNAIRDRKDFSCISGLSFRREGHVIHIPEVKAFEKLTHKEIPYDLIPDYRKYGQLDQNKIIFSMYSVLGCPYKCTFCSSPAQYRGTPGKVWSPIEVSEVVDHVTYVVEKYHADYVYFIDDDSFVNLAHVEGIIDEIAKRGLKVKLGFRGARINEIKKMSDAYLEKLCESGTDMIHIGAESGSDRILRMIKKNCTIADILDCNRKLARHPKLTVGYNFMMGLPSETLEEVKMTRDLWFAILKDNPRAILFQPNKFRPLPGTELFETAVREWGYTAPKSLTDWMNIEVEGDYEFPWYPKGMKKFCDLMLVGSYFVDDKIFKVTSGTDWFYRILRLMSRLYSPIAKLRLRKGWSNFLIEYNLYRFVTRLIALRRSFST